VLLALPWVVLWGWLDWSGQRTLDRELSWLRNHGFYLSADEIPQRSIPDEQNAALVYEQALGPQAFVAANAPKSALDPTGQSLGVVSHFLRDGTGRAQVQVIMADPVVLGILDELERGSRMPDCVLLGEDLERLAARALRNAGYWLHARARLCTEDGDPDEALRWVIAMVRMSQHIDAGTGWGGYHGSRALRSQGLSELEQVLSSGALSARRLTDLQDTLAEVDPEEDLDAFLRLLSAEAIRNMEQFRADPEAYCRRTGLNYSDLPSGSWFALHLRPYRISRPLHNSDLVWHLRSIREAYEASRTVPAQRIPPSKTRPTGRLLPAIAQSLPLTYRDIMGVRGSLFSSYPGHRDRDMARLRLAEVAIALALHEAEHAAWPETLAELASASGQPLPTDPYSGQPFHYERRDHGFILSSAGGVGGSSIYFTWTCSRQH